MSTRWDDADRWPVLPSFLAAIGASLVLWALIIIGAFYLYQWLEALGLGAL